MPNWLRGFVAILAVLVLFPGPGGSPVWAAGGSPPHGPIDPVETGSDLKFACGQEVEGFDGVVGEQFYRWMLIVQCRAVVGTIAATFQAGEVLMDGAPRWRCVVVPEDLGELSATFVNWVARRPALMRESAVTAFVEAIELSAPCQES